MGVVGGWWFMPAQYYLERPERDRYCVTFGAKLFFALFHTLHCAKVIVERGKMAIIRHSIAVWHLEKDTHFDTHFASKSVFLRYFEVCLDMVRIKREPTQTACLRGLHLICGRGSKNRTHDTRFWRPLLYQLSYTPIFKKWWAIGDSNPGPSGYEPDALTN